MPNRNRAATLRLALKHGLRHMWHIQSLLANTSAHFTKSAEGNPTESVRGQIVSSFRKGATSLFQSFAGAPGPGADVAGAEPSPGADVAGAHLSGLQVHCSTSSGTPAARERFRVPRHAADTPAAACEDPPKRRGKVARPRRHLLYTCDGCGKRDGTPQRSAPSLQIHELEGVLTHGGSHGVLTEWWKMPRKAHVGQTDKRNRMGAQQVGIRWVLGVPDA